ncbi:hypothetical protein SFC88_01360 [Nocardioides sp. HM23]|uniref:hypothetical protein n=1 Tax=Nocardioides bizhenqiangii TaxID=3095076 RepID=UPI002ACA05BC|nr:hypothetical protein [Nocardioides sp. HM23]MDZ5619451.1 hypothetical protein [Nocardioides sp. HM23]
MRNHLRTTRARRGLASLLVVGALGTALGVTGGAQAAALITGQQIKDGTVTSRDVRNATVTGRDVADSAITMADIVGDQTGPAGPRGEQGRTGQTGLEVVGSVSTEPQLLSPGTISNAFLTCGDGRVAIGGGLHASAAGQLQLLDSSPLGSAPESRPGWVVRAYNPPGRPNATMVAYAVCAEVR